MFCYLTDPVRGTAIGRFTLPGGWRMEGDAAYFSRRANEERVAAMKAAHPRARQSHLVMAERYDEFAGAIASHQRLRVGSDSLSAVS